MDMSSLSPTIEVNLGADLLSSPSQKKKVPPLAETDKTGNTHPGEAGDVASNTVPALLYTTRRGKDASTPAPTGQVANQGHDINVQNDLQ